MRSTKVIGAAFLMTIGCVSAHVRDRDAPDPGVEPVPAPPVPPPIPGPRVIPPSPLFWPIRKSPIAIRPVMGGTLLVLRDGRTAVAADPDRATVFVADLETMRLLGAIRLEAADEPWRAAEDAAGRVHVVLRGSGALATIDPRQPALIGRRALCPAPRGIAYQAATDQLHVACASGELVSLPAAGEPTRTLGLELDLRDVVVDGDRLLVTRFRSAETLVIDPDGKVVYRLSPSHNQALGVNGPHAPDVAWRAMAMPGGGALMVHQRAFEGMLPTLPGGYGMCAPIVESTVSLLRLGQPAVANVGLRPAVQAVDLALSPDGKTVALVTPWTNGLTANLIVKSLARALAPAVVVPRAEPIATGHRRSDPEAGADLRPRPAAEERIMNSGGSCPTVPTGGAGGLGGAGGAGGSDPVPPPVDDRDETLVVPGEAAAVAFTGSRVVVQTRSPAALELFPATLRNDQGQKVTVPDATIPFAGDRFDDTGHTIFHADAGSFIACASCHPEGGDDGRVWSFSDGAKRRTQSLRGGVAGTAPFHWDGMLKDMAGLVDEVFVKRMRGPELNGEQAAALAAWIETIPRLPARPETPAAARGRALFFDPKIDCARCHAGPRYTNNLSMDVGTGGVFQTPSLLGVGWRAPFMHDGCAPTLRARFAPCGGSNHGNTAQLSEAQLADLIAFLETL
jgi:hypothetical protein